MIFLEKKQFSGVENVMSPIFGLPCREIGRDYQNLHQPGHGSRIILLWDLRVLRSFVGVDWD